MILKIHKKQLHLINANSKQTSVPIDTTLSMRQTPSLRQRKPINIRRFNKQNKETLDKHQLSMIDTAPKYTVLSSVAFITSLTCTTCIDTQHCVHNKYVYIYIAYIVRAFRYCRGDV